MEAVLEARYFQPDVQATEQGNRERLKLAAKLSRSLLALLWLQNLQGTFSHHWEILYTYRNRRRLRKSGKIVFEVMKVRTYLFKGADFQYFMTGLLLESFSVCDQRKNDVVNTG